MNAEPHAERAEPIRPTGLEWFALAASLVLTLQYSWVLDDAYIYARYVDNLVHLGRGLVFNEGEYVEGYSSPLWCLLLVPFRAVGLNWWSIFRVLGLASAAATWWTLVVLARRAAPSGVKPINVAALLLCFNYAVQSYFTSGVESPLVQLAAAAYALYVFDPRSRAAAVVLGLAPMIRHELALPLAIAVTWGWRSTRRFPWLPCVIAAATLGGWVLFRLAYYADVVPNTFYLKDEVNWSRGWRYLHDTASVYGVYWLAPLFAFAAWALARGGANVAAKERWVLLAAATTVALYVAKIGGDPRHYRYLAFPFCVLACASQGLAEHALVHASARARAAARVAAVAIALGVFALYPRQLSGHPVTRTAEHLKVDEINDAQFHRAHRDLAFDPYALDDADEQLDDAALDLVWGDSPLLPPGPSPIRREYRRWLESGAQAADLEVQGEGWCASAWKRFNRSLVHKDGLTDPVLARAKVRSHRAAHKRGLMELTQDVCDVRNRHGSRRGAFRAAVEAGDAPAWIRDNLPTLEQIERKQYNRHDFGENVGLVLRGRLSYDPGVAQEDDARDE